ncbi:glutathione S-transferase family protein [Alteromonas stellipolaris]|jgi:glutathione S-transferase|uniref:glutathione S-transferase family protein n=1 Tax=Alteromonas stellipolaris TaxID=233316 RepID=UPI002117AD9C|nr:glutathione S-transferase family protein [Alteromonas stellipolaris]MCQ8848409.1 glutathione S-transferase family protein [Alteromonas stellipolaris]
MKLYGSVTSPFVRRIRVVLSNTPHEFLDLQIFSGEDRELLASRNPTLKVPCLEDNGQLIFDSRVIYSYLASKLDHDSLSWEEENLLTLIDAANDSFVQLMLLKRSDIDINQDKLMIRLQKERIESVFSSLSKQLEAGGFSGWTYPEICLYSMVDWVLFRELHSFKDYPLLLEFHEKHRDRIELTATDPRQ